MRESGALGMILKQEESLGYCPSDERDVSLGMDKVHSLFLFLVVCAIFSVILFVVEQHKRKKSANRESVLNHSFDLHNFRTK